MSTTPATDGSLRGECPHCGTVVSLLDGLVVTHNWPLLTPTIQFCPGSGQHPQDGESNRRFDV